MRWGGQGGRRGEREERGGEEERRKERREGGQGREVNGRRRKGRDLRPGIGLVTFWSAGRCSQPLKNPARAIIIL